MSFAECASVPVVVATGYKKIELFPTYVRVTLAEEHDGMHEAVLTLHIPFPNARAMWEAFGAAISDPVMLRRVC